jgi:hypothetical protein
MIAEAANIMHHVGRMSLLPPATFAVQFALAGYPIEGSTTNQIDGKHDHHRHADHRGSDAGSGSYAGAMATSSASPRPVHRLPRGIGMGCSRSTVASCSSFSASLVHISGRYCSVGSP